MTCLIMVNDDRLLNNCFVVFAYLFVCFNLLECFEELRSGSISLHIVSYNSLGQRFGAPGFSNHKQRNPQLNANHHHENVFAQSSIACNVWAQF